MSDADEGLLDHADDPVEQLAAMSNLRAELHESARGGRVVTIRGAAGAGKSTLINSFVATVDAGVRVLHGMCDPLATPRPFGPIHDIGRDAGRDVAALLAGRLPQEAVLEMLLSELSSGPRPTVMILEDLQWADQASRDMLVLLIRRLHLMRAMIVLTLRPEDFPEAEQSLRQLLSLLPTAPGRQIELHPLSPDGVAELARRAGRDAADLHALTSGNPLLVTEALTVGVDEIPDAVLDLAIGRMQRLDDNARELASLVAIVPGPVEIDLLDGATGDAIDDGVAAGLLVATQRHVTYRHELIRQAIEQSLGTRAADLHATLLSRLIAIDADPARIAHHAHRAGDIDASLHHAQRAAHVAGRVGAHREALAHLQRILPHAHRLPERERAELLESYAIAAHRSGRTADARAALDTALPLWRNLDHPERAAETLRLASRMAWWAGESGRSTELITQAIDELEALPIGPQLAAAYSELAGLRAYADQPTQATALSGHARALAHRAGNTDADVEAQITLGAVRLLHGNGDGTELRDGYRAAMAADQPELAARALQSLATASLQRYDFSRAAAPLDDALAHAVRCDLEVYARFLTGLRARVRLELGDWRGAQDDAQRSLDNAGTERPAQVPALLVLGLLRARTGMPGARELLDRAADYAYPTDHLQFAGPVAAARMELFWLDDDVEQMQVEMKQWLPAAAERHPFMAGEMVRRAWQAGIRDDLPDSLPVPYRDLVSGDWSAAHQTWNQRGHRYAATETLACGDERAVARALQTMDELGATRAARRIRSESHRRGDAFPRRPRTSTRDNPAQLTDRQLEVLQHLAAGHSNAEIAEHLVLSPKTATHHVSAVLTKLGVRNRRQAAAAARSLNLLTPQNVSPGVGQRPRHAT